LRQHVSFEPSVRVIRCLLTSDCQRAFGPIEAISIPSAPRTVSGQSCHLSQSLSVSFVVPSGSAELSRSCRSASEPLSPQSSFNSPASRYSPDTAPSTPFDTCKRADHVVRCVVTMPPVRYGNITALVYSVNRRCGQ